MKRSIRIISHSVFTLGVLGSLSFGAAQAFGMSRPEAETARSWCNGAVCIGQCGGYGVCHNNVCNCY